MVSIRPLPARLVPKHSENAGKTGLQNPTQILAHEGRVFGRVDGGTGRYGKGPRSLAQWTARDS